MFTGHHSGLRALNATQFLGALNDNILKFLIIFYSIHHRPELSPGTITATAGAVFVLPFLFFSPWAGNLASRYSKSSIIRRVKLLELFITAAAVAAFSVGSIAALYTILFAMATHSALFAPSKYGIIPELVEHQNLTKANGAVEAATFLAIILGTATASLLVDLTETTYPRATMACVGVALLGWFSALQLPNTPPSAPHRVHSIAPTALLSAIRFHRTRPSVMVSLWGFAWFMLVGAFSQMNLIGYGMKHLHLSEAHSGYLFFAAAIGIAAGSLSASRLHRKGSPFGLVFFAGGGMMLCLIALGVAPSSMYCVVPLLLCFGFCAGVFSVPLQTGLQAYAEPSRRAELLAGASMLNWIFVLLASLLLMVITISGRMQPAGGFILTGLLHGAILLYLGWRYPVLIRHAKRRIARRILPSA